MSFLSPRMLLLLGLIPAVVVAYRSATRRRSRRATDLAAQGLVVTSAAARIGWRRHVPFALFVVALTALGVALARPEVSLSTPRREGTVILAFDVSNSMAATDLEPSRLEAAKGAARAFVERQPSTILVGVVAFGDGAVVAAEPTSTTTEVLAAIDRLSVEGGTSLGQGLFASLNAIAGKPLTIDEGALASDSAEIDIGYYGSASIIVLSDGENTGPPDPLEMAGIASVAGVQIHAIGVGTEEGTVVSVDGFNVATALNGELLGEVARISQGTYYEAGDAASLAEVYGTIDTEVRTRAEWTEVTALFTAGGALLLVVGALLSVLWLGRVV